MKADVSIKWRSERAADCPLVEEKTCGLCFWTKPRGLSMTGTLQSEALWWWRAPLCFMFTSDWSSFRGSSSQVNLAAFFSRWVKMPYVCVWSLEPFQTFMLMFGSNKQEISEVFSWIRLCWFVDSNIKAGQQHESRSEKTQWKQRHLLDTYCGHMW